MEWLATAFRSARVPIFIAPGNDDFIGPIGGYTSYDWPENVKIFDSANFSSADLVDGVRLWGAAHTQAHRDISLLEGVHVDRVGVNVALFHGAELTSLTREPDLERSAPFAESDLPHAGFDHALVGHYQGPHFGTFHTYPGAPLAHAFGATGSGGAVLVTFGGDGGIQREYIPILSPTLHEVEVNLTGIQSKEDALWSVKRAIRNLAGILRISLVGRVSPDIVIQHEDLEQVAGALDQVLVVWNATPDLDLDQLAEEPTIRGRFVLDVLSSTTLTDVHRQRVMLAGLRALAGHTQLEGPR
jgi:exonuclease SbcD